MTGRKLMTQDVSADDRRRLIVQTWEAAWDRGEVAVLDQVLAEDYRRRSSADDEGLTREEFKASIVSTRHAFPDLVTQIDDLVVEGDRAAVRWHSVGTHTHPFLGVPATKRRVRVAGATFVEFDERGLVVLEYNTWDPRALLTALGIVSVGQDA
jgi:steroid delta-isomerase-like uncharacterized protein